MRIKSINTRLFIYSMVFCFTGVVFVGSYSYFTARKALIARTHDQLTSLREEKKARLETFFRECFRDMDYLAMSDNAARLRNIILGKEPIDTGNAAKASYGQPLLNFIASGKAYSGVSIGLPDGSLHGVRFNSSFEPVGNTVSTLNANAFDSLFCQAISSKELVMQDFGPGTLSMQYTATIAKRAAAADGEPWGVLFLEIPADAINAIMAESMGEKGLGRTGEVYLVGSDSLLRSSSRFVDESVLRVKCTTSILSMALAGEKGVEIGYDYRNTRVLSSYGPMAIRNLNWAMIAEIDYDEAMWDIYLLGRRILLIGFAVFVLLTVGVMVLGRKITAPLMRLTNAAARAGEGDFDQMLPIEYQDEAGLLTEVFNKMIVKIKHTTGQLREREQRLSHFYQATVDGILLHKSQMPVMVNQALTRLTGYTEEELMKKTPGDIILVGEETLLSLSPAGSNSSFEGELKTKSGQRIPVEVQRNSVLYHGQRVESLVIRDISKRKAVERELQSERLRQMKSVIDGQEQERQRLSRELHDGLGQTLVAIKLKLESIPLAEVGNQRKTIESVKEMFNQTIEETRRMSNNLMPAALTEFSLAVVLRNLCTEIESNSGINVSLVIGVLPESLGQVLKTYVYRIVQEALNNVVKHSGASRAVVSIFSDILKLYLHIEDNGVGFDPGRASESGNGLYNMKERALLLNGKFEIITAKGKGVKILAEFPIYSNKSENR
jgi:PAS domain S-box-containing protein